MEMVLRLARRRRLLTGRGAQWSFSPAGGRFEREPDQILWEHFELQVELLAADRKGQVGGKRADRDRDDDAHHVAVLQRGLQGAHLFVRARRVPDEERPSRGPIFGLWYATPLLAVLVVIELTDVIFAVDSIPAIFGVTREPFIVFSATALALVGLRSLYFLLAGMRDRFAYLDSGLAVILVFIGAKFLLTDIVEIGAGLSLSVIVLVMGTAIGASLLQERRPPGGPEPHARAT
jgi:predicted tellurium resistance membrane protein TerC